MRRTKVAVCDRNDHIISLTACNVRECKKLFGNTVIHCILLKNLTPYLLLLLNKKTQIYHIPLVSLPEVLS